MSKIKIKSIIKKWKVNHGAPIMRKNIVLITTASLVLSGCFGGGPRQRVAAPAPAASGTVVGTSVSDGSAVGMEMGPAPSGAVVGGGGSSGGDDYSYRSGR